MGMLPAFRPSTNGLPYVNAWPSEPDAQLQLPPPLSGTIPIGNAQNGLCGGMTYAVRDLWEASRLPPVGSYNPRFQSEAYRYLVQRSFDSFDVPVGIAEVYEWMNLPAADLSILVHGTSWRTIEQSMPAVRSTIDGGHPCPLCLVCVHSADPLQMGENHQVLAYGYEDQGGTTTVSVCDPNWPGRDDVTITFATGSPRSATRFVYSTGDHSPVGFFPTAYKAADPSALFEDGYDPPAGWQTPQSGGTVLASIELVFQPFPDVDSVSFLAHYATDPSAPKTVGWHPLPTPARQDDGTWTAAWDTTTVPDQGSPGAGTVNLAASSSKSGTPVPPTVYALVTVANA